MKTMKLGVAGLIAALTLAACNSGTTAEQMDRQADRTMAEFEENRHAAVDDLRDIRVRLDQRLEAIEIKLQDPSLTDADRQLWEARRAEARAHVKRVDDDLARVQGATTTVWEDVKQGVSNTAKDVGNWFEEQAEKIDRNTDADLDNDGK